MLRLTTVLVFSLFGTGTVHAADEVSPKTKDGNRLAYLDECNPWYPDKDSPKLITPQWIGEEGVEAVIVLAIDDMRDPAKYEAYLRPILNRLKEIDGRAPVSIMTCDVKPHDPQLQSWLGEGLSIECHTIDHPCPILQGGDRLKKVSGTLEATQPTADEVTPESSRHLFEPSFAKAKSTYDRCVDLMGQIPGNKPVAFRTPCCDSLNTVSPRFYAEIFNSTTENNNFLQIDSSVFTFFTSEDESLPKELVLDASGNERFWKYLPKNNKYGGNVHNNFVNYIKNYPYPYVINNTCWEIPCIAPSDWSAQHLHGANNPTTVEDWKAAIDLTVHKQGCFSLVFHPHGWIKPEQVVEMIDHAVAKHGKKVKFLNFAEVAERLKNSLATDADQYRWNEVRVVDVDNDGFMDVIDGGIGVAAFSSIPEKHLRAGSMNLWKSNGWRTCKFPVNLMDLFNHVPGVKQRPVQFFPIGTELTLAVFDPDPVNPQWDNIDIERQPTIWAFDKDEWHAEQIGPHGGFNELKIDWGHDGALWRDFDGDGRTDLLLFHNQLNAEWDEDRGDYLGEDVAEVWSFDATKALWESREWLVPISPSRHSLRSMRFVDIDQDGHLDLLIADATASEIWLQATDERGWTDALPTSIRERLRPITKTTTRNLNIGSVTYEANNGFFIHDRHFCWINEETSHLPDLMYRVSFDEILAEHKQASGDSAAEQRQDVDSRFQISNLKSEEPNTEYDPVPIGAAVVDITPEFPVRLTGYGNRMKESEGVAAKIHARALVIEQSRRHSPSDEPAIDATQQTESSTSPDKGIAAHHSESDVYFESPTILITVDNCGVPLEITEAVFARIAAKHDIPRERFAISSTHTHSGPWLRGFAPNIFAEIPEDHAAHLAQYEKDLIEKLVEVVDKAIESRRPGHLSYGFGEAGFAMNRRALTNGKWSGFGEVPDGPIDKRVPVLAAHDTDGKLIAVLANYACHCTTETGEFNQISGDWAGFAADILEADHPGAVALIAIGCGADANPSPRGTHEQAKVHGRTMADEVNRLLRSEPTALAASAVQHDSKETRPAASAVGSLHAINPNITCNMARIDLPLGPLPSREDWEQQAKEPGVTGSRARYFLKMLDESREIPSTIPNYPVQTWCFGDDLAMVFLGGEVVVDYSLRMNDMFDGDRLWINAYSNDVPCYIASARVLREGGYEADSSMLYYRRPTRLAPEAEDVLCDAVQKIMPHEFYSKKLQEDFPAPKSPEESLKCMTTKPDLRVVLAASEPLIHDPVAFDWDERGRLWVVEMGDYPSGEQNSSPLPRAGGEGQGEGVAASGEKTSSASSPLIRPAATFSPDLGGEGRKGGGRVQMLEDTDKDGVYDKATTFLDGLAFPNGIHCWRGGVIVTMAPEIFYAEDTDGDGKADVRQTLYKGFTEGNQQHRVNGLRWGLDGWLYLANGDSGGEIAGTGYVPGLTSSPLPRGGGEGQGEGVAANHQNASSASNPLIRPAASVGNSASQRSDGSSPDLGGEGTRSSSPVSLRGRDLRINPDTNGLDTVSGQTQFGRERDDFGNWFGNNNSNPIYQYVLEDRYVRRNPHAAISQVIAPVSVIPGAAPVYPTSRTLARFNDFAYANRFTSACSTMIYRDNYLGERYYGNAFTSEPVHNLVSRLVLTRDGYGFKGERAADEQESEFLASTDNWFRPTMIRTGPDGAIWVADMYRAVIEHPEWIPPEYQRKMNLYAGNHRGRIYRIVPAEECCSASSPLPISGGEGQGEGAAVNDYKASSALIRPAATFSPDLGGEGTDVAETLRRDEPATPPRDDYFDQPWNEIPLVRLRQRMRSDNGWWRDTAHRILIHRMHEMEKIDVSALIQSVSLEPNEAVCIQAGSLLSTICDEPKFAQGIAARAALIPSLLDDVRPQSRKLGIQMLESSQKERAASDLVMSMLQRLTDDDDSSVRLQLALTLGEIDSPQTPQMLARLLHRDFNDKFIRDAALTSLNSSNIGGVLKESLAVPTNELNEELIGLLLVQAAAMGRGEALGEPLTQLVKSIDTEAPASRFELIAETLRKVLRSDVAPKLKRHKKFESALSDAGATAIAVAKNESAESDRRAAALRFAEVAGQVDSAGEELNNFLTPRTPTAVQMAAVRILARSTIPASVEWLIAGLNTFDPIVHAEVLNLLLQRESTTELVLNAVADETLTESDFNAIQLDGLLNHRSDKIASRAKSMLSGGGTSTRAAVVEDFRSQISNLKSDAAVGKVVFGKRCGTCHRLQDVGKEVGADLAALKDRSTEALLTAVLDPNRAVESKFLVYSVVTKDGLQHVGMLKGETGGSLTLIGSDGKETTVARADIEELAASKRSLMPEGLEKELSAQDLADVIAFVQSTGTPWKRFEGNSPQFVKANADGSITLPASAAEIYGPNLVFEPQYGNLGFWQSTDDYAKWTFEIPKSGHWTVEFDFACDDSTAGSLIKFSTGNRMLTARVPGSGTWDNYQSWQAGTIDLHSGRGQLIITAPEKPPFALIDLRAIRLLPPK